MKKFITLSKKQKDAIVKRMASIEEEKDGVLLVGEVNDRKRSMSTLASELPANEPLRIAYENLKNIKTNARQQGLKGDIAKGFIQTQLSTYKLDKETEKAINSDIENLSNELDSLQALKSSEVADIERIKELKEEIAFNQAKIITGKEIYRLMTLLLDGTLGKNLVDNYYIVDAVQVVVTGREQTYYLVNQVYLGNKQLITSTKRPIGTTIKDSLTDSDLFKTVTERDLIVFENLLMKLDIDRKIITIKEDGTEEVTGKPFSEYLEDVKIQIEGDDKAFYDIKNTLLKYYIAL